jgi:hypothetical protein
MREGSPPLKPIVEGSAFTAAMPQAAAFYGQVGRSFDLGPHVATVVKAAIALRRAVQADDYPLVNALYREFRVRKIEPAYAVESGYELGVSADEMRAFAARHRSRQREAA